jgi:hypothetical protein
VFWDAITSTVIIHLPLQFVIYGRGQPYVQGLHREETQTGNTSSPSWVTVDPHVSDQWLR